MQDLPAPESSTAGPRKDGGDERFYEKGSGKKKEDYFSIFGSNSRKGAWDVPEKIDVLAIMGSQVLDFTEARFPHKAVKIDAVTCMGSLDLKVPSGVHVSTKGIPILGSIDNKAESSDGGPEIIVEGVAILGKHLCI